MKMQRHSGRSRPAILFAAAMAAAVPAAAAAHPDGGAPAVAVPIGDLDLARRTGLIELNARIRRAAYRVCEAMLRADPPSKIALRRCVARVDAAQSPKVRALATAARRERRQLRAVARR